VVALPIVCQGRTAIIGKPGLRAVRMLDRNHGLARMGYHSDEDSPCEL